MTPERLIEWRLRHRLSQVQLAKLLFRTRVTVHRWETGKTPLPVALEIYLADAKARLSAAEAQPGAVPAQSAKPVQPEPEFLSPRNGNKLRPDLRLYEKLAPGKWLRGPEHPRTLLAFDDDDSTILPWSVLASPEYIAALAAHRAATGLRVEPRLSERIASSVSADMTSLPSRR